MEDPLIHENLFEKILSEANNNNRFNNKQSNKLFMSKNPVKRSNEAEPDLSTIERDTRSLILDFLQEKFEENDLSQKELDDFALTKMRMQKF